MAIRKERIFKFLEDQTRHFLSSIKSPYTLPSFNTSWISEQLGLSRDNVSRDLNQLYRENRLLKIHGKPVFFLASHCTELYLGHSITSNSFNSIKEFTSFFLLTTKTASTPTESLKATSLDKIPNLAKLPVVNPLAKISNIPNESPFLHLIGYNRSLKAAVKQAKAAILYPPQGLHSLIIGPTGGGKTTLAHVMYIYAQQTQHLSTTAPYIVFNCADYAGNPQLLLSHLFGHKKGAFTGATTDHIGLVAKANHGILFLDEIHRLPPEGQEMLFSLMDRGQYYRLGDSDILQKSQVLILAATTEKPGTAILQTFLRRIPNLIQLPDLENRSIEERYDLIKLFFQKESKNMGHEIYVSAEVLKLFLIYDCPGNIGQLENDIKLICANAFVNFITEKTSQIHIKLSHLPAQYIKYFDVLTNKRISLNASFDAINLKALNFSPIETFHTPSESSSEINFYQIMLNNSKKYFAEDLPLTTMKEIFNNQITEYFDSLTNKNTLELLPSDESAFLKIISPQIYHLLKEATTIAEQKYHLQISAQVFHGLVLHVETLIERIKTNKPLVLPKNNIEINEVDIYYQIATLIVRHLEKRLEFSIPKQEIILISLCLQTLDINRKNAPIGILVLTHGYHAATDFAEVANRLLGVQHAHGFCMPLEEKVSDALERVTKLVEKINAGRGVLLLADMGSLATFGDLITETTGIPTRTLRMVTTPMVIEATRKALLPTASLEQLAHEVETQSYYIGINASPPLPSNLLAEKLHFNSEKIIKLIENVLVFIDARKAVPLLEKVFSDVTTYLNIQQEPAIYIKFIFHSVCMLERAIRDEQLEYKNLQPLVAKHNYIYNIIKDTFSIIEKTYGITIQNSELGYITEIFVMNASH